MQITDLYAFEPPVFEEPEPEPEPEPEKPMAGIRELTIEYGEAD